MSTYKYIFFQSNKLRPITEKGFFLNITLTAAVAVLTSNLSLIELTFIFTNLYLGYELYQAQQKVWANEQLPPPPLPENKEED